MDLNFASFKEIVKSLTIEMVEKAVKKSKKEAKQSKQDSITDRMFPDRHNQVTQHSITVRMGTVFEKAFNKFAKISGALPLYDGEDIEKHQMLFNHETDTLFRFPQDTIYCFENKTGAGVDTEKTQKTKLKVTEWETELTKNNNARVICKVLTAGSPTGDSVKNLKKPLLATDVFGYQEFFQIFHINVSEIEWNQFLEELGKTVSTILGW